MDEQRIAALLKQVDEPRPMPDGVRARIEDAMLAEAAGEALPRMPAQVRAQVAASLTAGELLEDAARPRPMPDDMRERLVRTLVARARRRRWSRRSIGAAAALTLIAASALGIVGGDQRSDPDLAAPNAPASPLPTEPATDARLVRPTFAPPLPPAIGDANAGLDPGPAAASRGAPPPFSTDPIPAEAPLPAPEPAPVTAPGESGPPASQPPPPPPPPLVIGVIGGDPDLEAGFRRYLELMNDQGGLLRRRVDLVEISSEAPAGSNVLATVNLSGRSVSAGGPPAWTRGPLLEGLDAVEPMLTGRVWSAASPPERQAHLLADALFPSNGPGTAAIYRGTTEPFATTIPDAIEEVLSARGVTVVRVTYPAAGPAFFVPAQAAILSLSAADAGRWLDETAAAGHQPRRGIGGIYTLQDDALLDAMSGRDVVIVSPYRRPDSTETRSKAFGNPVDYPIAYAHGWLTAKNLAVAIWRHGSAQEPSDVTAALRRRLPGFNNRFAPPFEVRPGTNARTPEGLVFTVSDGRFIAEGEFLRDPY